MNMALMIVNFALLTYHNLPVYSVNRYSVYHMYWLFSSSYSTQDYPIKKLFHRFS